MMSKNNQREHQKFGLLTNIQLYKTSRYMKIKKYRSFQKTSI